MSRSCAEQPLHDGAFARHGGDPAVTMPAEEATVTPRIGYTVGYEGVEVEAVALAAQRAGVTMVIDTRRNPTSRRPAFRREALRRPLEAHGIGY